MSSIFLGPALLHLANVAAGCIDNENDRNQSSNSDTTTTESCSNTIYGFRPSSLLTNIAAVSGMIGCFALPFIGSVMDHTNHRKCIGAISGMVLCGIKILEYIGLSNIVRSILPNSWFYIAILQIVASVTFYTHLTAAYAYLSELSSIPQQQSRYNTSFFVIMYGSTLVFMVEVLSLSTIFQSSSSSSSNNDDDDDVDTAEMALIITIMTCTACFYYSWTYCFPYTPAKKVIPLHQSVYSAGFYTLFHTLKQLLSPAPNYNQSTTTTTTASSIVPRTLTPQQRHEIVSTFDIDEQSCTAELQIQHSLRRMQYRTNQAMFYILCSVSFSEAAANAIIVISTTYMKEVLQFNGNNSYVYI